MLSIPDNYKVLFLQGGASTQFAAIPMNLLKTGKADYALTGNFANNAYKEAVKFGDIHVAFSSKERNFDRVPTQAELDIRPDADYFYICANNTIYGTEWQYVPRRGRCPWCVICPLTSSPGRWTCPNSASSMPEHRRTWPPPG